MRRSKATNNKFDGKAAYPAFAGDRRRCNDQERILLVYVVVNGWNQIVGDWG
jgi:hypothetical protein